MKILEILRSERGEVGAPINFVPNQAPGRPGFQQQQSTGDITAADLAKAIGSVDPGKAGDAYRIFRDLRLPPGVSLDTLRETGGTFPGASSRSQAAFLQALNLLGNAEGGEREGIAEAASGETAALGLAGDYFSRLISLGERQAAAAMAIQKKLLGLAEEQAGISRTLFKESTPLRQGITGAAERELGLRNQFGDAAAPSTIFRRDLGPEISLSERLLGRSREDIIASSPGRGGQLATQLGGIPLERARLRSGLQADVSETARQQALAIGSGIGFQTPSLALQGLGQGSSTTAAGGQIGNQGLAGQVAATGAAGSGQLGVASGFGAIQARGLQADQLAINERLGLASLAAQDRAASAQAGQAKKGASAQGGQAIGSIIGIIAALLACWVAGSLYGYGSEKFYRARAAVLRAPEWVRRLYIRYGPALGRQIREGSRVRYLVKPVFDLAVLYG